MGWVSPTGGSGTNWYNLFNARDESESSYAFNPSAPTPNWTSWVELTVPPKLCDKIRFNALYSVAITSVEVEAYYDGAYHPVYTGVFLDHAWVEKDVIPGSPGQTKVVSKMRLRFYRVTYSDAKLYEVDFNQVAVCPVVMRYYRNMRAG